MTTTYHDIPGGDAGTVATLERMRHVARSGALEVATRDLAAAIVAGSGRDGVLHAQLLGEWVGDHTTFLADPLHAEAINQVSRTLELIRRYDQAQIDCDDVAVLAAALGLSVGLRARFVAVAFGAPYDLAAPYAHVWAELSPAAPEPVWLTIDPTRPTVELPPIARRLILEV